MARRRIQEWSGTRRIGRRIDPAAISSSARIRPHEAQHTAGAPAEVRVEHVGIVPIDRLHPGWALKVAGIIRRPGSAKGRVRRLPTPAALAVVSIPTTQIRQVRSAKRYKDFLAPHGVGRHSSVPSLKFVGLRVDSALWQALVFGRVAMGCRRRACSGSGVPLVYSRIGWRPSSSLPTPTSATCWRSDSGSASECMWTSQRGVRGSGRTIQRGRWCG